MKTKTPKISVLIPAYNYARYLPEAIDSVLAQSYQDFELIIVDNCSTDNTIEVLEKYVLKDSRVKIHVNKTNIGMYRNYNQALLLANGDYIKFLNADDTFHPNLLEEFMKAFQSNPSVSLVTSHRKLFGNSNDVLKSNFKGLVKAEDALIEAIRGGNWIGEPTTVMFKKENLTLGFFDTSLLMFADYDMWLRQIQVGDVYVVDKVLSYFREHSDQGTVYLNNTIDKRVHFQLQFDEYRRFVILTNKYQYNLYNMHPDKIHATLRKLSKISVQNIKYAFSSKEYSRHLMTSMQSLLLLKIFYFPKKVLLEIKKLFK